MSRSEFADVCTNLSASPSVFRFGNLLPSMSRQSFNVMGECTSSEVWKEVCQHSNFLADLHSRFWGFQGTLNPYLAVLTNYSLYLIKYLKGRKRTLYQFSSLLCTFTHATMTGIMK